MPAKMLTFPPPRLAAFPVPFFMTGHDKRATITTITRRGKINGQPKRRAKMLGNLISHTQRKVLEIPN